MTKVRLEIDEIKIHRPKKNWNLYFVILADHPTEEDKMIMTTLPASGPFKLSRRHQNTFLFDTEELGAEGLFVLSRELPEDRELNVHIRLFHTRKPTRDLGEILTNVEEGVAGDAFGIVDNIVGSTLQWLVLAKTAVSMVGKILTKVKDRPFGFASAFERFGSEFEELSEIDREKHFTGDASLVYSWSVDE